MKFHLAVAAFCLVLPQSGMARVDTPPEYRAVEADLSSGLKACLGEAGGNHDAAFACADGLYDRCAKLAPDGETTVGYVMCGAVASRILDREMNAVWSVIRKKADATTFARLLEEQRAWLKIRDRKAHAASRRHEGGSMGRYSGAASYVGDSAERLATLHEIAGSLQSP